MFLKNVAIQYPLKYCSNENIYIIKVYNSNLRCFYRKISIHPSPSNICFKENNYTFRFQTDKRLSYSENICNRKSPPKEIIGRNKNNTLTYKTRVKSNRTNNHTRKKKNHRTIFHRGGPCFPGNISILSPNCFCKFSNN